MTTFLHKVTRRTTRVAIAVSEPRGPKELLVDTVLAATADADWSKPGFEGRTGRSRSPRGEVMLATLTYCYAIGMYSSAQIETEIYRNRNNAELLAQMTLDRQSLTHFRKYNRDLIKACLAQVLGEITVVPEQDFSQEAEQRIEKATTCDFVESDS